MLCAAFLIKTCKGLVPSAQGYNLTDKANLRIMSLEEAPTSLRDKIVPVQ